MEKGWIDCKTIDVPFKRKFNPENLDHAESAMFSAHLYYSTGDPELDPTIKRPRLRYNHNHATTRWRMRTSIWFEEHENKTPINETTISSPQQAESDESSDGESYKNVSEKVSLSQPQKKCVSSPLDQTPDVLRLSKDFPPIPLPAEWRRMKMNLKDGISLLKESGSVYGDPESDTSDDSINPLSYTPSEYLNFDEARKIKPQAIPSTSSKENMGNIDANSKFQDKSLRDEIPQSKLIMERAKTSLNFQHSECHVKSTKNTQNLNSSTFFSPLRHNSSIASPNHHQIARKENLSPFTVHSNQISECRANQSLSLKASLFNGFSFSDNNSMVNSIPSVQSHTSRQNGVSDTSSYEFSAADSFSSKFFTELPSHQNSPKSSISFFCTQDSSSHKDTQFNPPDSTLSVCKSFANIDFSTWAEKRDSHIPTFPFETKEANNHSPTPVHTLRLNSGFITRNICKEFPHPPGYSKVHENTLILELPFGTPPPTWWRPDSSQVGSETNGSGDILIGQCYLRLVRTNTGRYQVEVRYLGRHDPSEFGLECLMAFCRDIDVEEVGKESLRVTMKIDSKSENKENDSTGCADRNLSYLFRFTMSKKMNLTAERLRYAKLLDKTAPNIDCEFLKRKGLLRAPLRKEERTPTKFKHYRPGKFDPNARWATPRAIPGIAR